MTVDQIAQALNVPKKRGVRVAKQGGTEGEEQLKQDMIDMISSPLSQMENPSPIPELSAAQIEALRALYTVINNESRTDQDLEVALEAAVKHLNPHFTPKVQEVEEVDGDRELVTGTLNGHRLVCIVVIVTNNILTGPMRRSERLARLPQNSYDESADDVLDELLAGEDDEEDDEEEGVDQQVQEYGEDREMDDVQGMEALCGLISYLRRRCPQSPDLRDCLLDSGFCERQRTPPLRF
jgi:hypothetical protein